jgi:Ca2+-binding RTX toxin-like protein
VTALEGGGFVVTWTEKGRVDGSGSEPGITVRYQVYDAEATKTTDPLAFYATLEEAESVGTPDVVALPGGGFALAAQVVTNTSANESEVRLTIFDAAGTRVSEKLLVSKPAAGSLVSLEGLSLLADGRIAALMSNGIQIIDPRTEAVRLKGTARDDHYIGTALNDTFDGSAGADRLEGGEGFDVVSFADAKTGVAASLTGGSGGDAAGDTYISIEGLLGSSFDDVFIGNGSAILKGRAGNDTYHIKAGDIFEEYANEGRDAVIVGGTYALKADAQIEVLRLSGVSSKKSANLTGSDIANEILGHTGTNTLRGLGGNDLIKASSGDDRVEGGSGDDTIHGGSGNDKLYGGPSIGKDVFVFDAALSRTKNVDRIYDFNPKYDSIQLENKVFTKLGKGSAKGVKFKPDMFVKSTQAQDREDRIIYDSKTGALYYDQDGTGSKAQVKIATLSKKLKLTHADFFVI